MQLSILICSLHNRSHFLERLLKNINIQKTDDVEVIVELDGGEKSTGEKRNILLNKASGEYVMFVDDDDLLMPNAIELILKAIQLKPDVVGMNLLMSWDGGKTERSYHSLRFTEWFDIQDPLEHNKRVYFRNPNHINPIRRELAVQVGFPNITQGEDRVFSNGVKPLLKSEVFIDQPIYLYLFRQYK